MHRPGEGVFGRGSNVLEYWLANSQGFALARSDGKRRVTAVVLDPETRQARSLVIRRSRRRTQVVAADAITAVDPHGRVLYLAQRRRRPVPRPHARPRPQLTAAPALQAMRTTQRHAVRAATAAGAHTRSGAQRATAVVRPRLQALVALLRPLVAAYAHNAAHLARAYLRAAEARLRGPWTPSSPPSWTRRAPRSPAARSRMAGHWRRASKRCRDMTAHWRS